MDAGLPWPAVEVSHPESAWPSPNLARLPAQSYRMVRDRYPGQVGSGRRKNAAMDLATRWFRYERCPVGFFGVCLEKHLRSAAACWLATGKAPFCAAQGNS